MEAATKYLLSARIKGKAAERRDPLGRRIDRREEGHHAGYAVDAPDRTRAAALVGRTELAGEELRPGRPGVDALDHTALVGDVDRDAIGRGRGEKNVRLRRVVERHAEDLTDLRGGDGEGFRHL